MMTEKMFETRLDDGITQIRLPNTPEGDAYTFYFYGEDEEKLKTNVIRFAFTLKETYYYGRKTQVIAKEPNDDYTKAIYVRVGVAFDNSPPTRYQYNLLDVKAEQEEEVVTSYRGGVIAESERAEAHGAPWQRGGIGVTQPGEKVQVINDDEVFVGFDSKYMTNLWVEKIGNKPIAEFVKKENVNGFILFIHYHYNTTMDDVKEDPTLYTTMLKEFNDLHKRTAAILKKDINARIVKIKRSSDAMFYAPKKAPSTVWNTCLSLCAKLPHGSSIGICFTDDNKLSQISDVNHPHRKDYFGDTVNLAARMEMTEWQYDAGTYSTMKNLHACRVAMCCADNKKDNDGWSGWGPYPFTPKSVFKLPSLIEDVPREDLNAGEGTIRVISAHVVRGDPIRIGDVVCWTEDDVKHEGTIVEIGPLKVRVKEDGIIKGKYLTKIKKVKQKALTPLQIGNVAPLKF
jgi:hypothetical protein